jgi:hypothetical protein
MDTSYPSDYHLLILAKTVPARGEPGPQRREHEGLTRSAPPVVANNHTVRPKEVPDCVDKFRGVGKCNDGQVARGSLDLPAHPAVLGVEVEHWQTERKRPRQLLTNARAAAAQRQHDHRRALSNLLAVELINVFG